MTAPSRTNGAAAPDLFDCYCDTGFRDALDMLAFEHWFCIDCGRVICGGGVSHKALGHHVRKATDAELDQDWSERERKYHDATACPRCGGSPGTYMPTCTGCRLDDDGPEDKAWENEDGFYDGHAAGCNEGRER